jgi:predicted negative regulator of RcsB-dependent stress response
VLKQSAALDPDAFFVNIELGNIYLRRGSREEVLRAYKAALQHAPSDNGLRQSIQEQIKRVSVEALDQIHELPDTTLE